MKRKFILLPITLTALAPVISLVGCGDPDTPEPPEPKYYEYEMKFNGASYESDEFNLEKDNYYTFLIDNPQSWKEKLYFLFNDVEGLRVKKVSVFVFYVLFDGNEVEFNIKCSKNMWGLSIEDLSYYEQPSKIEIYLKCIETTENVCGNVSIQT